MTERERLIELINKARDEYPTVPLVNGCKPTFTEFLTEQLLANGVIVLPCTPIAVMRGDDGNDTDVFCPYCGTNLSGLYGEEPTRIVQCYVCGEYLDNTKAITKEEAERELERRRK